MSDRHAGPRPTVDPPLRCASYRGGHEIHVIQARLSREAAPIGQGVATVEPDGWVTIVLDDGTPLRRWTHDPRRLAQLLSRVGGEVTLRTRGVLAVANPGGSALVSVTDEPSPCPAPDEDTSGWTAQDHVERRGGFLIAGPDLDDLG